MTYFFFKLKSIAGVEEVDAKTGKENLPVPGWIVRSFNILICAIVYDADILDLVDGQRTRVIIESEKIRTSLDQQFLLGRENGQSRRIVALGSALLVHLLTYTGIFIYLFIF